MMPDQVGRRCARIALGLKGPLCAAALLMAFPVVSAAAPVAQERWSRSPEVEKILSVVETRVTDEALARRVRQKLLTVNRRQVLLLAALADRAVNGPSPATDVAFLVLAVLIVLD
jgi:hypothetical protein